MNYVLVIYLVSKNLNNGEEVFFIDWCFFKCEVIMKSWRNG